MRTEYNWVLGLIPKKLPVAVGSFLFFAKITDIL
jgi:hypothetical protein